MGTAVVAGVRAVLQASRLTVARVLVLVEPRPQVALADLIQVIRG